MMECDDCRKKPGMLQLCNGCLHIYLGKKDKFFKRK